MVTQQVVHVQTSHALIIDKRLGVEGLATRDYDMFKRTRVACTKRG